MEQKFIIIGMDDNPEPFFPPEVITCIRQGKIFSGGMRHKEKVKKLLPENNEWISITVPLEYVFRQYEKVFTKPVKRLLYLLPAIRCSSVSQIR